MNLGLFGARADDRGLGRLTHDFYRHMRPARTLVIDMGAWARQFKQHLDRYPTAEVVPFNNGQIDPAVMCRFFTGLDVAIMYETAYDHRAYDIARQAGCRTVLMTMPEFHRHATEAIPGPDEVWLPTCWRADLIPEARVVPAPVALDEAAMASPSSRRSGRLRVLHVAGHRASGDRNGTLAFLRAVRLLRSNAEIRVTTQDARLPQVHGVTRQRVQVEAGGHDDHWRLYQRADLLVMPRRYGGLCLPVQEAMASGLAVAMTGCPPNPQTWPVAEISWHPGPTISTPGGQVGLADPDVGSVADLIDRLAGDPAAVEALKARSRMWAEANSWDTLRPLYQLELGRAAAAVPA